MVDTSRCLTVTKIAGLLLVECYLRLARLGKEPRWVWYEFGLWLGLGFLQAAGDGLGGCYRLMWAVVVYYYACPRGDDDADDG